MPTALQRLFARKRAKAREEAAQKDAQVAAAAAASAAAAVVAAAATKTANDQVKRNRHASYASSSGASSYQQQQQQQQQNGLTRQFSAGPTSPALTVSSLASLRLPDTTSASATSSSSRAHHPYGGGGGSVAGSLTHRPRSQSVDATTAMGSRSFSSQGALLDEFGRLSMAETADLTADSVADEVSAAELLDVESASESSDEEEEEEFDENPLYHALSETPLHQDDWESARLVLLPPSRLLHESRAPLEDATWVALHALAPSRLFRDQWVSVRAAAAQGKAGASDATAENYSPQLSASQLPFPGESSAPSSPESKQQAALLDAMNADLRVAHASPRERSVWHNATLTVTLTGRTLLASLARPRQPVQESTLTIASEVVVYRTPAPAPAPTSSDTGFQVLSRPRPLSGIGAPAQRDKIRIRVLCVSGLVVPTGFSDSTLDVTIKQQPLKASPSASIAFPTTSDIEDESIIVPASSASASTNSLGVSNMSAARARAHSADQHLAAALPLSRELIVDILLLLSPPSALAMMAPTLSAAFAAMQRGAHSLRSSYVLVRGFDAYDAARVRRGVLSPALQMLDASPARLPAPLRARLTAAYENVALGLVHAKLYPALRTAQFEQDEATDALLATYSQAGVTGAALGISVPALKARPARLDAAVAALESLGAPEADVDALFALPLPELQRAAQQLEVEKQQLPRPQQQHHNQAAHNGPTLHYRTPLDTLSILCATLEAIGIAIARAHAGNSRVSLPSLAVLEQPEPAPLGTDELLPVVMSVIVRAQPRAFASALHYAHTFGINEHTAGETTWALTTFEAALEALRKDPLNLCAFLPSERRSSDVGIVSRSASVRSVTSSSNHASSSSNAPLQRPPLVSQATNGSWRSSNSTSEAAAIARARRVSLPASAHLGPMVGGTSMSRSGSSTKDDSSDGSSPIPPSLSMWPSAASASQDGFKVPGLPASAGPSRRGSRANRPQSVLGILGEGFATGDEQSGSTTEGGPAYDGTMATSLSQPGRASSLTQGSSPPALHVRPQIVRTRRAAVSSASATVADRPGALERTLSFGSASKADATHTPLVRVVGSPQSAHVGLGVGGASMARAGSESGAVAALRGPRRKSLDSWTAMSFFSRAASEDGFGGASKATAASSDVASPPEPQPARPMSPASITSATSDGAAPTSSSSIMTATSWLPAWSDWGTARKRGNTAGPESRPDSIASAEGMSASSTFSTLPRSSSGSGFAATLVGNGTSYESTSTAGGTSSHTSGAMTLTASRRSKSIRSVSSFSSNPTAAMVEDAGSFSTGSSPTLAQGSFTAIPGVAERRRRLSRLMSSSSSSGHSSGVAMPSAPQLATYDATAYSMRSSEGLDEHLHALAAAAAASGSSSMPSSPALSMPTRTMMATDGISPTSMHPPSIGSTPSQAGTPFHMHSSNTHVSDSFFPFLRLHVPSPVHEIADPLASAGLSSSSASVASMSPALRGRGPILDTSRLSPPGSARVIPLAQQTVGT